MPTRISSVRVATEDSASLRCTKEASVRAESAIGWGPFGSGPRFGGEEKKGSKASRTGPGQGERAASPGFSTNDRMRVCWGAGGWARMLVLEFGNWGFEGLAGNLARRKTVRWICHRYSRRARLVEWEPDVQWEAVMGGASATWASSR